MKMPVKNSVYTPYKGVAGGKYCEQIASGYTLCEEETIDFDCSSEDFSTAIGTITHAHCDHYSNIYEKRIRHLESEIDRLASLIHYKQLEAAAMSSDPMMIHFVTAIQVEIVGLNRSRADAVREKSTVQEQLAVLLATGIMASEELPNGESGIDSGGIWPFGFKVVTGQNIAAAYYKTTFLYNDSRMKAVQSFCDAKFGVFYFAAAGYYWWDTPFVERSHTWEEQTGYNALGNPTYQVWKSHFDLYMGIPNPLKQKDLHHEQPPGMDDGTLLGDWLQKYTPYGIYVFNKTELLSTNLDTNRSDDIEPPQENPMPQLHDKIRPSYHQGWYDPKHPIGDSLFFNDRHAPVRYDRVKPLCHPSPFVRLSVIEIRGDFPAVGILSGRQSASGWRTDWRGGIKVCERCPFGGELVDVRCLNLFVSEAGEIVPSQIVDEDE